MRLNVFHAVAVGLHMSCTAGSRVRNVEVVAEP